MNVADVVNQDGRVEFPKADDGEEPEEPEEPNNPNSPSNPDNPNPAPTTGATPLAGELEARLGPGRGFEEQVDVREPFEQLELLLGSSIELDEAVRDVEQMLELPGL